MKMQPFPLPISCITFAPHMEIQLPDQLFLALDAVPAPNGTLNLQAFDESLSLHCSWEGTSGSSGGYQLHVQAPASWFAHWKQEAL